VSPLLGRPLVGGFYGLVNDLFVIV